MESNAFNLLMSVLSAGIKLLRDWYIPGTNISPLSLILFSSFTFLVIKFIKLMVSRNSVDVRSIRKSLGDKQ